MEDPLPGAEIAPFVCIIAVLILASGFFNLFYFALEASQKTRLQTESKKGNEKQRRAWNRVLEALENRHIWFLTVRVWTAILRISAAVFTGFSVMRFSGRAGEYPVFLLCAIYAAALSLGVVLLGDIFPRLVSRLRPEGIARSLLPLASVFALPLRPFNFLGLRLGALLRSAFQGILRTENPRPGITEDELRLALDEGEKSGIVESKERTMVEGVFYLGDRPVGAFMTHRSEIEWLDPGTDPNELRAKVTEHRNQRCFPVADGSLDQICGAAYLEDILLDQADASPKGLRGIMKKPLFVPETMTALKAFESFKQGEADFLFVMDEYGGFAGLISVRDLMEEIVGVLAAPRQEEEPIIRQEDGTWLADGSLNVDDAADALALPGLASDHAGYHTLAGFVLSLAGELPRTGDSFAYQGFHFTVVDMDGNRIDKLLISREGH